MSSASTNAGAWFGTLGIHTAVFAGTSLIFGYLRRHKLFRRFYAAKRCGMLMTVSIAVRYRSYWRLCVA